MSNVGEAMQDGEKVLAILYRGKDHVIFERENMLYRRKTAGYE